MCKHLHILYIEVIYVCSCWSRHTHTYTKTDVSCIFFNRSGISVWFAFTVFFQTWNDFKIIKIYNIWMQMDLCYFYILSSLISFHTFVTQHRPLFIFHAMLLLRIPFKLVWVCVKCVLDHVCTYKGRRVHTMFYE